MYNLTLPPPLLSLSLQVEEKPDVTYGDVGGCKEQIEKLKEVVETPLLHVNNITRRSRPHPSLPLPLPIAREVC